MSLGLMQSIAVLQGFHEPLDESPSGKDVETWPSYSARLVTTEAFEDSRLDISSLLPLIIVKEFLFSCS